VEVSEGATTTVDFTMTQAIESLDEVVVVGYGEQQRKDVTGSVASIDAAEEAETKTLTNVAQLFQSQAPGLNAGVATQADGGTGELEIRGRTSIQAGNDPLIVVDGVPYHGGDLSTLNPNDIESIDVLKGASAAAVYGASAAAGVIEVTTKQGTTPEPTIQFKGSLGMATRGSPVRPYGPEEYLQYMQDVRRRLNPATDENYYADPRDLPSGLTLEEWKALGKGSGEPVERWLGRLGLADNEIQNFMSGNTVDWNDLIYRSQALRQTYDLSVSGEPESMSYYWSVGYTDNQGQLTGSRFETLRSRLNLSANVTDWLEVGLRGQYANQDRGTLVPSSEAHESHSPFGSVYEEDGTIKRYPEGDAAAQNPLFDTPESGKEADWKRHNMRATLFGEVSLPLGFQYKARWTNDYDFQRNFRFNPSSTPAGRPSGTAMRQEFSEYIWQVENILTWSQMFADIHEIETTFLFNVEVQNDWSTAASNAQFPLETLGYSGLAFGENPSVGSEDNRSTANGLMGRLNYRLLDRYLFTVSYRRDGYSAFGQNYPYAYFPSAAFAWRVSEEPFFEIDPISNLKLRLSWGKNGNRSIGPYSALQRVSTNKYLYGQQTVTGLTSSNLPNQNLQWETTTQYNAGLDFGLFSGRLSGSINAYYMSTTDLLMRRSLPNVTGYDDIWTNLGEVVNRGLELSMSSANVVGEEFSWRSDLTFSLNRNEIKSLYGTGEDDRGNGWFIGKSLSRIYDYEVLGVWQQDEAEEAAKYGKEPGDFKLRDVNGDGNLTPLEDKVFQGNTKPRYRIGLGNDFSYKNFSASAQITAHLGQFAAHDVHKHAGFTYGRFNQYDYPYWTPDNPTNEWARLGSAAGSPPFSYWENTSFVRLQNVSLSYRIPDRYASRLSAEGFRVFLNARNVFTLTGYDGNDPETLEYTPRLYTAGLNLSF
jgi:TonB-linked SusC/RagA family outer membrane protein